MAIKQRSVLSTQNTTLSTNKDTAFPDNNNKEITAADLRTWLDELLSQVQDILDSYFNKLDELRITSTLSYDIVAAPTDWNGGTAPATQNLVNDELASRVKTIEVEPNQTAFQTPYSPASIGGDWLPEGDPTEVKGGLDILAGRTGVNLSEDIAYVSVDGVDTEGVLGNSERPFKTFGAAINAIPIGGTVKALGGSYNLNNETVSVGAFIINKNNITLDISGCEITGRFFYQADDVTIIARGATITNNTTSILFGFLSGGHSNCKLIGGTFNGVAGGSLTIGSNDSNITFIDATFTSNLGNSEGVNAINCTNGRFINCQFISNANNSTCIGLQDNDSTFINCKIESGASGVFIRNGKGRFYNCKIKGDQNGIIGTNQTGFSFDCIAENSYIEGLTNRGIIIGQIADNVRFTNCIINGGSDCVLFTNALRTTANNNNIFERCSLYAGTGDIFAGTYDASDLGNSQVTNCIYNKALTPITEVVENNITTITGIQNVEF